MSKIKYEIFDKEAEILEYVSEDSDTLELCFKEKYEGLLSIDGIVSRVIDGKCSFNAKLIDFGKHEPILVLKDGAITLPAIIKSQRRITLSECTDDYTRRISLRERRLCQRVEALEKELSSLRSLINTTTIF